MSKKILIVDDEPHMRQLVKFTLRKLDAQVLQAGGGEAALAVLAAETVDLLIVDVTMTGMDGFAVVKAVREDPRHANTPVLMLTARGLADVRTQADALKVAAFFTKPFSPVELAAKASELLA